MASIAPGDAEYGGVDLDVSDPDADYDDQGNPRPRINRRYDKYKGLLTK